MLQLPGNRIVAVGTAFATLLVAGGSRPRLHALAQADTPAAAASELLAADRAFSDAGAAGDAIAGLSRMFDDTVRLLVPGRWVRGRDSALAVLRTDPRHREARASWQPIRAGVSADGTHGFTAGYQTIRYPDTVRYAKYVSYWVRGSAGWRVVAYKRVPASRRPSDAAVLAPSLPERLVRAAPSARQLEEYRASLRAAEIAFSDDAGRRGIGAAFRSFGAADALNVGGPDDADFRRGPEAIAQGVEAGIPAGLAISWGPDEVLVAPGGDLGVSMGMIAITPEGGQARRVPFLTVWRRKSLTDPWRYVAE